MIGVLLGDGTALAFPVTAVGAELDQGGTVEIRGVRLTTDGAGFGAVDIATGEELAAHEAFWFAWSQFNPDTLLWAP